MNNTFNGTLNQNRWFITCNPEKKTKYCLVCFPFAGGGASVFRHWHKYLSTDIEVIAIQYPGRENRIGEPPIQDMNELVSLICKNLIMKLDRPFVFFGHSLGAKIAFETILELERRYCLQPVSLLVSGCRAPHLGVEKPIHHLEGKEFILSLRSYNGTPEEVLGNRELMEVYLPMLKADFQLDEKFTSWPEERIECPIYAFGGNKDKIAPFPSIMDWSRYTKSHFDAMQYSGDHFFFKEHQTAFLKDIQKILRKNKW